MRYELNPMNVYIQENVYYVQINYFFARLVVKCHELIKEIVGIILR